MCLEAFIWKLSSQGNGLCRLFTASLFQIYFVIKDLDLVNIILPIGNVKTLSVEGASRGTLK